MHLSHYSKALRKVHSVLIHLCKQSHAHHGRLSLDFTIFVIGVFCQETDSHYEAHAEICFTNKKYIHLYTNHINMIKNIQ